MFPRLKTDAAKRIRHWHLSQSLKGIWSMATRRARKAGNSDLTPAPATIVDITGPKIRPPDTVDSDPEPTESSVNTALRHIVDGVVGFDTESVERKLTPKEQIIHDTIELVGGSRKAAMLGLHMLELKTPGPFHYAWDTMGLCVVQISRGRDVWIIHLRLMRTQANFDIAGYYQAWNDLRLDLVNLIDVGMMARLVLARKYSSGAYQNLSMETSVEEFLGCQMAKSEQTSDWSGELSPAQVRYAAMNAIAALHLYVELVPRLKGEARRLQRDISSAWYSFNSRMGEPTRMKRTIRDEVVPWSVKDSQERDVLNTTNRPSRHATLDPLRPLARRIAMRRYHEEQLLRIARDHRNRPLLQRAPNHLTVSETEELSDTEEGAVDNTASPTPEMSDDEDPDRVLRCDYAGNLMLETTWLDTAGRLVDGTAVHRYSMT
ncbi:hypothetical protein B0H17DRAFT_1227851 [Mycena rosella]|uniref:3'-5' exonuclease domain-containing protein n=1 Tax=Mycena rosella TaxID=1033263 RepID=A0AAD7D7N3_MYCRO|nr:hypothetical protein B0H17DRAFT_1227851 [Mycena rosella]